jgi:hypothetical protein
VIGDTDENATTEGGRMDEETAVLTPHRSTVGSPGSRDPLEALVTEIGATYPLLAYTALAGEADETEAMNAAILAGLVSP